MRWSANARQDIAFHVIGASRKLALELERIGHAMVVKLNGGRGGEVAPF